MVVGSIPASPTNFSKINLKDLRVPIVSCVYLIAFWRSAASTSPWATIQMRSFNFRNSNLSRFRCALVVLAIGLSGRSACASSGMQRTMQPDSEVASASVDPLPDAPSALKSAGFQQGSGAADVPLERQEHPPVTLQKVPLNILHDGGHIAVSPGYLRWNDLKWMLPVAGATAAAFETDHKTMTEVVSSNPSFNQINVDMSNGLVGGFIAAPVAMFGLGHLRQSERMKETGLLGGEAIVDAVIVDEVVKLCAFRERPNIDNAQGKFFVGSAGLDSSFISEHNMIAWSSAAVLAGEYPSKWVQFGVYSLAAGVSATRIMGQQHFPSDVLLGATGGWLIGHYVFRAHHHLPPEHAGK